MSDKAPVDILLATYQGDRFLEAQLASLVSQDYSHWRLLVRDDGSTDQTKKILEGFLKKESRAQWLPQKTQKHTGVVSSFESLLKQSVEDTKSDYIMFCDQDDVWHSNKISQSLAEIQKIEKQEGKRFPILFHCDQRVIDDEGKVLFSSFKKRLGFLEMQPPLPRLLVQNFITGCTVMINRALAMESLPIPKQALMHDAWIGLIAASVGKVIYSPQSLMDYRQHGLNASGGLGDASVYRKIKRSLTTDFGKNLLRRRLAQSIALEDELNKRHPKPETLKLLQDFHAAVKLANHHPIRFAKAHQMKAQGSLRTLLYYSLLFLASFDEAKALHDRLAQSFSE